MRNLRIAFSIALCIVFATGFWNVSNAQRKAFSHTTKAHRDGKYANCASCHNLPTKNWTSARPDKQAPFPDVRTFPSHTSCFACHARDIYTAGGAFCGNCHTVPTMRARAVSAFPARSRARQFTTIFPHDVHQDLIAQREARPYATAHFIPAAFRPDDKPKPVFYNCAICHETSAAMPKFAARKLIGANPLVPAAAADIFTRPITAAFFKSSPNSHASCFTCHYQYQNLPPGKQNCSGCHASAKPYFEGKTLERYSLKFDHDRTGHVEKDCASCHIRITQYSDLAKMKDADVPVASCRSCHATQEDDPSKRVLLTELESRESNKAFTCTYCHTSAIGRYDVPASHRTP